MIDTLPYDPTILYLDFSPTYMATRCALPYDPTDMNRSGAGANLYTRNGGTNQKYLR